jgi:cytoskeletal protein CcmA (bactofilin family)
MTTVEGEITVQGSLHINGHVKGKLVVSETLLLGVHGICESNHIRARHALISGYVNGTIAAEVVEILRGGIMVGNIFASSLIVEPSGRIIGSSAPLSQATGALEEMDLKDLKRDELEN